jgi:hypothetical protein
LTPEEIQKAQDLLKQYEAQLTNATEEEIRRKQALIKIEEQLEAAKKTGLTEYQKQLKGFQDQTQAINQELKDNEEEINRLLEFRADLRKDDQSLHAIAIDQIEQKVKKLKEANKERINAQELIKQQQLRQEEFKKTTDTLVTSFTGIKEQQSGVIGLIQKGMNEGKTFGASMSAVGASMASSFTSMKSPINVIASLAAKVVESTIMMVVATDQALANFNKMTAAGGDFNNVIFEASLGTKQFGVNMQETVAAATELQMTMASFSGLLDDDKVATIELAAALDKVGLSVKDFGNTADLAMKGFGMSSEEAVAISQDLLGVSQQLQVPLSQLGSDFTSSMAELAKHGPKGIEVFKELSAMSKAAGVEMSTLLGVAKGFDTIEGAAEKTSRLNAILGSTLNTVQMLNATESERVMLIKQSIDATGQSFGSMDRFKQQAIANAAGITNMADANKLFNTSGAKFREELAKLTGETGDLNKATSAATSISDSFKLAIESLAIAVLPLANIISSLMQLLVLLLTPVNMLFNGLSIVGTKMGELTGLGQQFGDNVTSALFLVSAALIYAAYQAKTLGVSLGQAFSVGILGKMRVFGISIYKNVIAPLGAGIMSAGRFALTMLTSVAGGLATVASNAIFFGASLLYDVVFGFAAATKAAYLFMLPFLPAIIVAAKFIAIAAVIAGIAYLIYDNWEFLVSWFTGALTSLGNFFVSLGATIGNFFIDIGNGFKGFLNFFIRGINAVIEVLNSISFPLPDFLGGGDFGMNISLIPEYKDIQKLHNGGDILKDGLAEVKAGERMMTPAQTQRLDGTVDAATDILATVPTMATAITNPVAAMASIAASGGAINEESGGLITALTEAIKTLSEGAGTAAPAGQQATQVPVILQLNERQLGKVMVDTLNNRQSMTVKKT